MLFISELNLRGQQEECFSFTSPLILTPLLPLTCRCFLCQLVHLLLIYDLFRIVPELQS